MNIVAAVTVIVFAATFVGADVIDMYLEHVKDSYITCAKEHGFTEQTLREMFDKDAAMGVDGATCTRACTMKATGMIKDSKLDQQVLDTIVKTVNVDHPENIPVAQKVLAECTEKVKDLSDECKMAYSFSECFLGKQ